MPKKQEEKEKKDEEKKVNPYAAYTGYPTTSLSETKILLNILEGKPRISATRKLDRAEVKHRFFGTEIASIRAAEDKTCKEIEKRLSAARQKRVAYILHEVAARAGRKPEDAAGHLLREKIVQNPSAAAGQAPETKTEFIAKQLSRVDFEKALAELRVKVDAQGQPLMNANDKPVTLSDEEIEQIVKDSVLEENILKAENEYLPANPDEKEVPASEEHLDALQYNRPDVRPQELSSYKNALLNTAFESSIDISDDHAKRTEQEKLALSTEKAKLQSAFEDCFFEEVIKASDKKFKILEQSRNAMLITESAYQAKKAEMSSMTVTSCDYEALKKARLDYIREKMNALPERQRNESAFIRECEKLDNALSVRVFPKAGAQLDREKAFNDMSENEFYKFALENISPTALSKEVERNFNNFMEGAHLDQNSPQKLKQAASFIKHLEDIHKKRPFWTRVGDFFKRSGEDSTIKRMKNAVYHAGVPKQQLAEAIENTTPNYNMVTLETRFDNLSKGNVPLPTQVNLELKFFDSKFDNFLREKERFGNDLSASMNEKERENERVKEPETEKVFQKEEVKDVEQPTVSSNKN